MRTSTPIRIVVVVLGCFLTSSALTAQCPSGPPTCHPDNPRYFADGDGNVLYLTGSHIWNNLQDWGTTDPPPALDFEEYLDFIAGYGHNFLRGWAWEHPRWIPWAPNNESPDVYVAPLPFVRDCPAPMAQDGKPRFRLTPAPGAPAGSQFNDTYFSDIRQRVQAAGERGIYVGVMLFQGWSLRRPDRPGDPWQSHPFHHLNNCSNIDGDPPVQGERTGQGLRIHTLDLPEVRAVQESYVRRIIDELNDLDNILWEITNESHHDGGEASFPAESKEIKGGFDFGSSVPWQHHMIDFIKDYEATSKPRQHLVWMTAAIGFPNGDLDASNADVVSYGGIPYRQPPVANGSKISLLDTDHIWGLGGDRRWVWSSFTRGHNPIFMDPEFGIPRFPDPILPSPAERTRIRIAMGKTLQYANRMDLAAALPRPDLCTTGHCLVDPGVDYLIYQPLHSANGDNEFEVFLEAGTYDWEHYDAFLDRIRGTGTLTVPAGGAWESFDLDARPIVFIERTGQPLPPAPTGVSATDDTFADRIRVTWNVVPEATSYEVYRNFSNDPAGADLIASVATTQFDHLEVYTPTVYYYWVKSVNAAGRSGFSNVATGTVAAAKVFFLDYNGDTVWNGAGIDRFVRFGAEMGIPVAGDWNGDGVDDVGVFYRGDWVVDMNGNRLIDGCGIDQCATFGLASDLPVVGDWNGDGRDQIGVFRNGNWSLDSNGNYAWDPATDADFPFGLAGDRPAAGDWNGDGVDDVGVYRGEGTWEVDYNGNQVWNGCALDRCAQFGLTGDWPVTGDWNDDGRDAIGVFRNGNVSLDTNGNYSWDPATDEDFPWGATANDRPAGGNWDGVGRDEIGAATP